ncbi:hypothetical protein [Streptacidiphilus neutrinimicus]|uniref:hypothetical protein n=1 Tax=Streptacidiphilus neutrinimicus TaxID=105420 RepID=UPI0005AB498A|nr:hypothetical protein [Streptacidiphilus neutrinimicus]
MATRLVPRPRLARIPSPEQRHQALTAIRGIAARSGQSRHHYACEPCQVGWAGPEHDCWNCGRPATARSRKLASTLQLLLGAVTPPVRKEQTA